MTKTTKGKDKDKSRQYRQSHVRRLDTLSRNQCYSPTCNKKLISEDGKSIISKICHIEAASLNGPRYNAQSTDDERRDFNNLILLCDECHTMIDNSENLHIYTVEVLKEWKKNHESISNQIILENKPSLLNTAINAIVHTLLESETEEEETYDLYKVPQKITYNELKRSKEIINDYKIYYGKLNSLYDELDKQGSFKKTILLERIKTIYRKVKNKYITDFDNEIIEIRQNADNIFDDVEEELNRLAESNSETYVEGIAIAIPIIMVDAFIKCKILEEPK